MRPSVRILTVAAITIAAMALLSGCSGVAASRSGDAGTATGTRTPHPRTGTTTGGSGAGGAGSLTVALGTPIAVAGHVDTPVTCTTGHRYNATAGPVAIDGTTVSIDVLVAGYSAPGSYSAVVTASVTPAGSDATQVAGLPGIPVTISATGGSVNLSATGTAGRVIAGSISWACS